MDNDFLSIVLSRLDDHDIALIRISLKEIICSSHNLSEKILFKRTLDKLYK